MIEIGRICYKIAGRESGKVAVVVDKINDNFVFVDGQVKRKRCNIDHLEPTDKLLKIKKNASHDEVVSELKKISIEVKEAKPKLKKEKPQSIKEKSKETKEIKPPEPTKKPLKEEKKPAKEEKKESKNESKSKK